MRMIEMKKIAVILLAGLFVLNSMPLFGQEPEAKPGAETAPAAAPQERPESKGDPLTKFGRGMCNFVTFYMEIPFQSKRVKDKSGSLVGMTYGLGRGVTMALIRAFVSVYEIVTFPLPYPAGYKPILTDPVSFFPEPPKRPSYAQ